MTKSHKNSTLKTTEADPKIIGELINGDVFTLGDVIFGQYEIFGIRRGGMGTVCFAEDIKSGNQYAIKTYNKDFSKDFEKQSLRKFLNELEIWLNIPSHPHIVKPLFIEVDNNQPFLFMEFISDGRYGSNLRDWINSKVSIGLEDALKISYQICLAMEFVNQSNRTIVHADLKPENILISIDNRVKVTDFGLAKFFDFGEGAFPHQLGGTVPYMSPEQLEGDVVDQRADIFSFGIIVYEMLTGSFPYPFELAHTSSAQRSQLIEFYRTNTHLFKDDYRFTPWRNLPFEENLKQLVIGCIYPQRQYRWLSFKELRQTLEKEWGDLLQDYKKIQDVPRVSDLHQKALSFYKIGRLSDALAVFNLALKESPDDEQVLLDAAIALADANMLQAARRFIERAKQLNNQIVIDDERLLS